MNKLFLVLFTFGSIALLVGSWFRIIPFTITEDLGFITGALTVWLTVIENIWNFPVGIANDIFFFILFLQAGLFADSPLKIMAGNWPNYWTYSIYLSIIQERSYLYRPRYCVPIL